MKQISKYIKVVNGTLLAGGLLLTACTSHFESWNINPNEVTPEQNGSLLYTDGEGHFCGR